MSQLEELLVEEMQDLLDAETQLTKALPKMAAAAHNPKLSEAFEKHLTQTQGHIERLRRAFELLGEKAHANRVRRWKVWSQKGKRQSKKERIRKSLPPDLSLITAAQKVEHYEISGYGTLRGLGRQIGALEVSELLSHTLREEEGADFLLSEVAKPLMQRAASRVLETLTGKTQTAGV